MGVPLVVIHFERWDFPVHKNHPARYGGYPHFPSCKTLMGHNSMSENGSTNGLLGYNRWFLQVRPIGVPHDLSTHEVPKMGQQIMALQAQQMAMAHTSESWDDHDKSPVGSSWS